MHTLLTAVLSEKDFLYVLWCNFWVSDIDFYQPFLFLFLLSLFTSNRMTVTAITLTITMTALDTAAIEYTMGNTFAVGLAGEKIM